MGNSSKIEWTEATWNPIAGCSRVSPGCVNCYAERMAKRLTAMGQEKYQGTVDKNGRWSGLLNFDVDGYEAPRYRKQPTVYFVNSMSDLFHPDVPPNWHMRIWSVMHDTPRHTYQILTKRADVMEQKVEWLNQVYGMLPNVWLGVSVENQQCADERIPHLLETPAAIRFLSCEPLLGPVDLNKREYLCKDWRKGVTIGIYLDWVIVGGESGPGARPMRPDWARQLRDQCQETETAFFFKQWGELLDVDLAIKMGLIDTYTDTKKLINIDGKYYAKVGKPLAGRLLDGRQWDEVPKSRYVQFQQKETA